MTRNTLKLTLPWPHGASQWQLVVVRYLNETFTQYQGHISMSLFVINVRIVGS